MDNNSRFYRGLTELSKQIDSDTLDNLKYLCQDEVFAIAMEKVTTAMDLFFVLVDCGKISINDTQYLVDLFSAVGRKDLVEKVMLLNRTLTNRALSEPFSCRNTRGLDDQMQSLTVTGNCDVAKTKLSPYHQLLETVCNYLTPDNIQRLCNISPEAQMAVAHNRGNISGSILLGFFEQLQLISPTNLKYLRDLLSLIGRIDLCHMIDQYALENSTSVLSSISPWQQQQQTQLDNSIYYQPSPDNWCFSTLPCKYHNHQQHLDYYGSSQPNCYGEEEEYHSPTGNHELSLMAIRGASNRNPSASHSTEEGQPPFTNQLHQINYPYDQQHRWLGHSAYSERLSGLFDEVVEPVMHRSYHESASAQSFSHQPNFETSSHSSVNMSGERYHSAPVVHGSYPAAIATDDFREALAKRRESVPGWQMNTNEFQHHSRAQIGAYHHRISETAKFSIPNEEICVPTQVEDDDLTSMVDFPSACWQGSSISALLTQPESVGVNSRYMRQHEEREVQYSELNQNVQLDRCKQGINSLIVKYPMNKCPHGLAVIVNNHIFHKADSTDRLLPNRRGSHVDEENLRVTWEYLRYEVCILRNLTASELTCQLANIAALNHKNYDSFVCCILSHGYSDGVYGADCKPVKISDIAGLFNGRHCPTLAEKPKMFFIQACRGDDEDRGTMILQDDVQKDGKDDTKYPSCCRLPEDADFLYGYATPTGKVSWRNQESGTWYISELCEVFRAFAIDQDLLSMLTIVTDEVSKAYTNQGYKQCPAPVSLLRKKVFFLM